MKTHSSTLTGEQPGQPSQSTPHIRQVPAASRLAAARWRVAPFLLATLLTATATTAYGSDVSRAGDVLALALPGTAFGATLWQHDMEGTRQLITSYAVAMGTTLLLKSVVDEQRPNGHSQSFPSGHTTSAFAGAGFIERRYGWKYGLPAYAAASFVGWSRVEDKDHWAGDVFAGALIGIASTHYFSDRLQVALIPGGAMVNVAESW